MNQIPTTPLKPRSFVRTLLLIAGTLCVLLGLVGMILPVLPTTPFLLLAVVCYAHSSERFHHWLLHNRYFGEYIRNYREGKGIPLKQKLFTILLLWLSIGYTAGFVVSVWWLRLLLLGIAVGVTTHLVRAKTYRPEAQAQPQTLPERQ